jgi:hypothetical protein
MKSSPYLTNTHGNDVMVKRELKDIGMDVLPLFQIHCSHQPIPLLPLLLQEKKNSVSKLEGRIAKYLITNVQASKNY